MRFFRARAFGVLLFGLLTLGQAYPFASAWALDPKDHPCCCASEMAKPCDCDHGSLGSRESEESGLAGSERGGMGVARREPPFKKRKFSCHSESRAVGISPAPCGAKTEASSLNFRGETCLPRFLGLFAATVEAFAVADLSVRLPQVNAVPEPPPPRV